MKVAAILLIALMAGCSSQSDKDKCIDEQAYLWNRKVDDNRYEGNQRYWDAVTACEDKYGD